MKQKALIGVGKTSIRGFCLLVTGEIAAFAFVSNKVDFFSKRGVVPYVPLVPYLAKERSRDGQGTGAARIGTSLPCN